VDALSEFDRQRIEDLNKLIRDDLRNLNEINQRQAVETRPLERRRLDQDAEQVRESYHRHCEEYADLLRKEIPTQFAPSERALIHTVVQRLSSDQLDLMRTALQAADHNPNDPAFTQLSAVIVAALPSVQQQLAAKSTPAANQVAHVAQIIQTPTADIKQKLKLSIPLIPLFLSYETEFNLNIAVNLTAAWERLKERFHPS
jgi:hypothetical protein